MMSETFKPILRPEFRPMTSARASLCRSSLFAAVLVGRTPIWAESLHLVRGKTITGNRHLYVLRCPILDANAPKAPPNRPTAEIIFLRYVQVQLDMKVAADVNKNVRTYRLWLSQVRYCFRFYSKSPGVQTGGVR